jgi:hypothetical protein
MAYGPGDHDAGPGVLQECGTDRPPGCGLDSGLVVVRGGRRLARRHRGRDESRPRRDGAAGPAAEGCGDRRGGGVLRARVLAGPRARGDRAIGAAHPVDCGWAHLGEFDGHAGLSAPGVRMAMLARWLLSLGIAATLAANVAHGLARPSRRGVRRRCGGRLHPVNPRDAPRGPTPSTAGAGLPGPGWPASRSRRQAVWSSRTTSRCHSQTNRQRLYRCRRRDIRLRGNLVRYWAGYNSLVI